MPFASRLGLIAPQRVVLRMVAAPSVTKLQWAASFSPAAYVQTKVENDCRLTANSEITPRKPTQSSVLHNEVLPK